MREFDQDIALNKEKRDPSKWYQVKNSYFGSENKREKNQWIIVN